MLLARRVLLIALLTLTVSVLGLPGCESEDTPNPDASEAGSIEVYCGRSQSLVEPIIERFEKETGITVNVRYGKTSQLALTLQTEGERTDADVFWAQDVSSLGLLAEADLVAPLDEKLFENLPAWAQPASKKWIATSGRARVLAYAPSRVNEADLPQSVFDLTDAKWQGRVGWAPTNGSFQAFVTAMRQTHGDARTLEWLNAMKANGAKVYPKNTPIVQALADGEIDLGIPNHYYLLRFQAKDPAFPVAQAFFKDGDVGNLVMVAGACVLKESKNQENADAFIRFVLSTESQRYFTIGNNEYPVVSGVEQNEKLVSEEALRAAAPAVELDDLQDLEGTLGLLTRAGLL